jgi:hypothetical protein
MTLPFMTRKYSTILGIFHEKVWCETASNCIQNQCLGHHLEKRQVTPTFWKQAGVYINQNYYIEHVLENHLVHATNLHGENKFCFQQDSAPSHKTKRIQSGLKDNLLAFFHHLIGLFCLGIHFENPFDQDSGKKAKTTGACRVHVVRKEMSSCCEGTRWKIKGKLIHIQFYDLLKLEIKFCWITLNGFEMGKL